MLVAWLRVAPGSDVSIGKWCANGQVGNACTPTSRISISTRARFSTDRWRWWVPLATVCRSHHHVFIDSHRELACLASETLPSPPPSLAFQPGYPLIVFLSSSDVLSIFLFSFLYLSLFFSLSFLISFKSIHLFTECVYMWSAFVFKFKTSELWACQSAACSSRRWPAAIETFWQVIGSFSRSANDVPLFVARRVGEDSCVTLSQACKSTRVGELDASLGAICPASSGQSVSETKSSIL